jgi:hypothetical protein
VRKEEDEFENGRRTLGRVFHETTGDVSQV